MLRSGRATSSVTRPPSSGEQGAAGLERPPEGPLDQRDLRVHDERGDQAQREAVRRTRGCPRRRTPPPSPVGGRQRAPHRVALAAARPELREDLRLLHHPRPVALGDLRRPVAGGGVDDQDLVDEADVLQRPEGREDRRRSSRRPPGRGAPPTPSRSCARAISRRVEALPRRSRAARSRRRRAGRPRARAAPVRRCGRRSVTRTARERTIGTPRSVSVRSSAWSSSAGTGRSPPARE